jgi:HPt (histidine-containing phosphotransfer) domain-containing protein
MPPDPEQVKSRLAELRRAFADQLPARMREIEEAWRRLDRGPWTPAAFQEFHRSVHALAGSGAMFGFDAISVRARSLDLILKSLGEGGEAPGREKAALISGGVAAMKEAAAS